MKRLRKFSLAWWRRQKRQRRRARDIAEAAGPWTPPGLSRESKRELEATLRDLRGEA